MVFQHANLTLPIILQYNQNPPIILLDCSKLQLGRGRLDDSVSSFRRRLELFRELTLPMLKSLDTDGRLTIVSCLVLSILHDFQAFLLLDLCEILMTFEWSQTNFDLFLDRWRHGQQLGSKRVRARGETTYRKLGRQRHSYERRYPRRQ